MNKIFERIIEAENIINDLYLDVNVDVEYCAFNKNYELCPKENRRLVK